MSAHANSTVADVLRAAKAQIDTPEKWAKQPSMGTFHNHVEPTCASGAIWRVTRDDRHRLAMDALTPHLGAYNNVIVWNDAPGRTHADVMAAFDRAIALAEAEGA